jgi:hypothetical protein
MQKVMLIGATLIGAVLLSTTPVSIKWSGLPDISNILIIDQAQARVGRPGTPVSVAGHHRRVRRATRRCATGVTC